jgi:hypothetical protein
MRNTRRASWLSTQSSQDGVTSCSQIFHIHMILKVYTLISPSKSIIRSSASLSMVSFTYTSLTNSQSASVFVIWRTIGTWLPKSMHIWSPGWALYGARPMWSLFEKKGRLFTVTFRMREYESTKTARSHQRHPRISCKQELPATCSP